MTEEMQEIQRYIDENKALRCELESVSERCCKIGQEKELLQIRIAELERERHYHLGQIEAYRFVLKGGEG